MRWPFTAQQGPTGLRRTRRAAQRSFVLPLSDFLVLIVLAVVAVASTVPERFQNAALSFPCAWNSEEGDVDDEVANADLSRFGDTLFQHDHRPTAVLVRSKRFGAGVTQDWESAAHMRVRSRAPPTRRGSSVHRLSCPCSTASTAAYVSPARLLNDSWPQYEDAFRPQNGGQRTAVLAEVALNGPRVAAERSASYPREEVHSLRTTGL